MSSSHDARLLTSFYNKNKYKHLAKPTDDANYKTGKPDAEAYERVKLYLAHQFTFIGAPQIWAGDEMEYGVRDDPDCRKPLVDGLSFADESTNPIVRKKHFLLLLIRLKNDFIKMIAIRKNLFFQWWRLEYRVQKGIY